MSVSAPLKGVYYGPDESATDIFLERGFIAGGFLGGVGYGKLYDAIQKSVAEEITRNPVYPIPIVCHVSVERPPRSEWPVHISPGLYHGSHRHRHHLCRCASQDHRRDLCRQQEFSWGSLAIFLVDRISPYQRDVLCDLYCRNISCGLAHGG